jgi:hypothetical protein
MPDSGQPLAPSGGAPHDRKMEARVFVRESDIKEIKADLGRIVGHIDEIDTRLLRTPTVRQLLLMQAGLIVAVFLLAVVIAAFVLFSLSGMPGD